MVSIMGFSNRFPMRRQVLNLFYLFFPATKDENRKPICNFRIIGSVFSGTGVFHGFFCGSREVISEFGRLGIYRDKFCVKLRVYHRRDNKCAEGIDIQFFFEEVLVVNGFRHQSNFGKDLADISQ